MNLPIVFNMSLDCTSSEICFVLLKRREFEHKRCDFGHKRRACI